jgi:hypothetical protein
MSNDEVMVRTLLGDWANRGWGMWGPGMTYGPKMVDDLVRLVRAEREACATYLEALAAEFEPDDKTVFNVLNDCAAAIRARGKP